MNAKDQAKKDRELGKPPKPQGSFKTDKDRKDYQAEFNRKKKSK